MVTNQLETLSSMVQPPLPRPEFAYNAIVNEKNSNSSGAQEEEAIDLLMEQQQQPPEMVEIPRMKKIHRSHSVEFKLHVLALAKEIGVRPAAKLYAISRKSITEWRAKEEKLLQLGEIKSPSTAKRLLGGIHAMLKARFFV